MANIQPNPNADRMSDAMILSDILVDLKHSSLDCAHAANEATTSSVRAQLMNMAAAANRAAERVFHVLHGQGYYPVPSVQHNVQNQFQNLYQPVQGQPPGSPPYQPRGV